MLRLGPDSGATYVLGGRVGGEQASRIQDFIQGNPYLQAKNEQAPHIQDFIQGKSLSSSKKRTGRFHPGKSLSSNKKRKPTTGAGEQVVSAYNM